MNLQTYDFGFKYLTYNFMWRIYWTWKNIVEDYSKTIDIKFLKKYWYLDKWNTYQSWWLYWKRNWEDNWNIWVEVNKSDNIWTLRVKFSQTNQNWEKKDLDYIIPLVSTCCNYWWVRWWFECPCKWNRCSILYLQNNWIFASRKSLNLWYDKQRKSKKWREFDKIFPDEYEAEKLYKTIKYKYRNWRKTRKYKKYLKLIKDDIPLEILNKIEMEYLTMK